MLKIRRYNCNTQSIESNSSLNKKSTNSTGCNCFDILLVDDDDFNLLILEKCISDANWRSRRALHGEMALEILKDKCPEGHPYHQSCRVIITDINMPVMNGFELSQKIR